MDLVTGMRDADKNPAQYIGQTPEDESQLQRMGNQPTMATDGPLNATCRPAGKQNSFAPTVPFIGPQLDKLDKALQLQGEYDSLRRNNIIKEEYDRHKRNLVGDRMPKMARYEAWQEELTARRSRLQASQMSFYLNAVKQETDEPIHSQTAFSDMKTLHERDRAHFTSNSGKPSLHNNQNLMSLHGDQINYQQHKSQLSAPQGPSSFSPGQIESLKNETFGMMSSKPNILISMNKPESTSITAQLKRLNVSAGNCSLPSESNAKTSLNKPTVGQKKPLEAPVSSLSKKRKVPAAFSDQTVDQPLKPVTAVSGLHLREEKEQLFSGSKEDNRVSKASIKVAQALQKKLDEIMAKRGVKNQSNDVEQCLLQVQDVRAELDKEREARQKLENRLEQLERDRERERAEQEEREKRFQKQFDEIRKK